MTDSVYTQNLLKTKTSWIFDMDGTLTLPVHNFETIRKALSLPLDVPILETLSKMPDSERAAKMRILHEIEIDLAFKARAQVGSPEVLSILRDKGCRLGILTRNAMEHVLPTLEAAGLAGFFDEKDIRTRDNCEIKPSPDGIFQILESWGAGPEQAVMVGDYLYDLQAGKDAGAMTVYLDLSGQYPFRDQADVCLPGMGALVPILTS